ncbi:SUMF1/EgtB/PvdO family nonheme iron enzyme [Candidatus Marithioploca araucensis]|uniref:SUMF1/EgtB/PvdO family nonheme iron enzyme n=1 Tax=Candidatus Marithioploca araucensis TaxID=70273 RepID=A0ABT7VQ50_9GAMM|nr:SUMF1/EgtB/PvdO family nonheme iron enzyme [Candidatus Marithioploca araucensis]
MMFHYLLVLIVVLSLPVQAARLALVIGNGGYHVDSNGLGLAYLSNPVNDAKDMAKVLRNLGFDVILRTDADKKTMKKAARQFGKRLRHFRQQTDVGLFYYSGHGFQHNKVNYLVPLRVDIQHEVDIEDEALRADYVLRFMKHENKGVNIVILDACRKSIPEHFLRKKKGFLDDLRSGLAEMKAPANSLIAYATQPNTDSWSGLPGERNSLYTKHLLAKLRSMSHLSMMNVFFAVRDQVMRETEAEEIQQVPWESVSLRKMLCFGECGNVSTTQANSFRENKFFRDRLQNGGFGPEMVRIPAGRFRMGDIQGGGHYDENPVHSVSVSEFAMGKYEVTFAEYDKFAQATGRKKPDDEGWGRGNRPVINVSWNDAVAYAKWLSQQTGKQYRLPTEAEWEYAARAGTKTKYWWGNKIGNNRANCDGCGSRWDNKQTAPVGSFSANPFGLYDTVGNVWEWNADPWHSNYKNAPNDGRVWETGADNSYRVLRGGSWGYYPDYCRTAGRYWDTSDDRDQFIGFRVAARL